MSTPELWVATECGVFHSGNAGGSFELFPISLGGADVAFTVVQPGDGSVLAGTESGVYATTGLTAGWQPRGLGGMTVRDLAVSGDRWIAATDGGVFVSRNAGTTWAELPGLADRHPIALLVDDRGRLLIGTNGFGLFRAELP